jgi:hypothetical protein
MRTPVRITIYATAALVEGYTSEMLTDDMIDALSVIDRLHVDVAGVHAMSKEEVVVGSPLALDLAR